VNDSKLSKRQIKNGEFTGNTIMTPLGFKLILIVFFAITAQVVENRSLSRCYLSQEL